MLNKRRWRLSAALLCVLLVFSLASCGGGSGGAVSVNAVNEGPVTLNEVYVAAPGTEEWGEDLFGGNTVMKPGASAVFSITESAGNGIYDLLLVDEIGIEWVFERVPLADGSELIIAVSETNPVATADGTQIPGIYRQSGDAEAEPAEPSAADPLDMAYEIANYPGGLSVPYPSTMKVCGESPETYTFELDAVDTADPFNNIRINMVGINDFDKYFDSGDAEAQGGLERLFGRIMEATFQDFYIESIGSSFVNAGSYYGLTEHIWLSGSYFASIAETPVRGVAELRYFGPSGFLLFSLTVASESSIQRYHDISVNILNNIDLHFDWSTAVVVRPAPQEGRGDYVEEDGWGDYVEEEGWGDYFEEEGRGDIFD